MYTYSAHIYIHRSLCLNADTYLTHKYIYIMLLHMYILSSHIYKYSWRLCMSMYVYACIYLYICMSVYSTYVQMSSEYICHFQQCMHVYASVQFEYIFICKTSRHFFAKWLLIAPSCIYAGIQSSQCLKMPR